MKRLLSILIAAYAVVASAHAFDARRWEARPGDRVQCQLCPRECMIEEDGTGACRVRKNVHGKLQSLTYAQICALNIDPVEKKPLYHFLPGTPILSVATAGCNLRCIFCQNWNISQVDPASLHTETLYPEQLVAAAAEKNCPSIAYTYNEPTVFYEYLYDTSFLARQHKIKNVWISSGYINPKPLKDLCTVLDAANIDLKGFSDNTYKLMANAKLSPVLETLKALKTNGVWLEVGYLVIPTVNDSPEELGNMVAWVAKNLGSDVPVHFLRFFPQHKLTNLPPTPIATLEQAYTLARKAGLDYVYVDNVPGHKYGNTYCPKCNKMILERKGYFLGEVHIKDGRCAFCGHFIAGIWK